MPEPLTPEQKKILDDAGFIEEGPDHQGICNLCGHVCFWQPCPQGGWWIHDWPSKQVEEFFKQRGNEHEADPGWMPVEEQDDEGNLTTLPSKVGCDDDTNHVLVPHDFWPST